VLDLDHFKQINDRYGHAAGDAVLCRLSSLLVREFRATDVVARWGGEEFVLGLYGLSCHHGVRRLTEFLEALRHEEFTGADGTRFQVTFSAGVAAYPANGADLQTLYRAADHTLYQAKATGRARVLSAGG
jgi:diguanylate cyclase (GGDEF)-like protein